MTAAHLLQYTVFTSVGSYRSSCAMHHSSLGGCAFFFFFFLHTMPTYISKNESVVKITITTTQTFSLDDIPVSVLFQSVCLSVLAFTRLLICFLCYMKRLSLLEFTKKCMKLGPATKQTALCIDSYVNRHKGSNRLCRSAFGKG